MNREDCVLYSGAASGAEATFGDAAERHGIAEVNFTFEGHNDARTRGMRVLTDEELKQGDVSLNYVSKLMHREYRETPLFKKVLQHWGQLPAAFGTGASHFDPYTALLQLLTQPGFCAKHDAQAEGLLM